MLKWAHDIKCHKGVVFQLLTFKQSKMNCRQRNNSCAVCSCIFADSLELSVKVRLNAHALWALAVRLGRCRLACPFTIYGKSGLLARAKIGIFA